MEKKFKKIISINDIMTVKKEFIDYINNPKIYEALI